MPPHSFRREIRANNALFEFLGSFSQRALMMVFPGSVDPLRLVWVGSSPQRWIAVALGEHPFDRLILDSTGSEGACSWPWAHGPGMLSLFASNALDGSHIGNRAVQLVCCSAYPHHFAARRSSNIIRFFETSPDQVEQGAGALLRAFPQSWVISSEGQVAPETRGVKPGLPPALRFSDKDYYFNAPDSRIPDPIVQVDGRGNVHWLWLPGAARALGSPDSLAISRTGLGGLLGFGDIIGESNAIASDDPDRFVSQFANALAPADLNSAGLPAYAPAAVIDEFIARDRRCAIERSAAPALRHGASGARL